MENLAPGPSSASPLAPPAKRQRTGARSTDLDLRVHVVDAGLSAAAAASLALPREVLLRVPRMSTGAELVPLLETALLGAGQGGQSSGAAAMGGSGWSWEFVVQHGEGGTETTRLEEGIWLVVFLDVGEEGPLVVEGRVKGV